MFMTGHVAPVCHRHLQPNTVADNNKPGQQPENKLHSTGRKLGDDIPPPVLAGGNTHTQTHTCTDSNGHKHTHTYTKMYAKLRDCLSKRSYPDEH